MLQTARFGSGHDDVIEWKHIPRYWPFVRGIHRSSVNSLHKGQWRGALMFSLICAWLNGWVNNREAGDLRRHRAHYDVTVMVPQLCMAPMPNYSWDARSESPHLGTLLPNHRWQNTHGHCQVKAHSWGQDRFHFLAPCALLIVLIYRFLQPVVFRSIRPIDSKPGSLDPHCLCLHR